MTETAALPAPLRIGYERTPADRLLVQSDVLAVIGFGVAAQLPVDDARVFRVGLEPLQPSPLEVWRGTAPVRHGRSGALRWSTDGTTTFFAIELDEAACGGIVDAAAQAYAALVDFVENGPTPHLLRLWNYLDAINLGEGDAERYRLFCDGRARGIDAAARSRYPAATAIGRQDGVRVLQVYGIASTQPGVAVENPRQVSAWRYPRQYGPTAPTFTRGLLTAQSDLLISGTAAVVGHASRHQDDLDAQLAETLANLDSLLHHAAPSTPSRLDERSVLKAYVRDATDADAVRARLRQHAPALSDLVLLAGDICRSELLVEIDGIHRIGA